MAAHIFPRFRVKTWGGDYTEQKARLSFSINIFSSTCFYYTARPACIENRRRKKRHFPCSYPPHPTLVLCPIICHAGIALRAQIFFSATFFPPVFQNCCKKGGGRAVLGSKLAELLPACRLAFGGCLSGARLQRRSGRGREGSGRSTDGTRTLRGRRGSTQRLPRVMGWTLGVFLGKGVVAELVHRNVNESSHLCCMHKNKKMNTHYNALFFGIEVYLKFWYFFYNNVIE